MKLIKSARVYRLVLPSAQELAGRLAEMPFAEMGEWDFSTHGFISPSGFDDLVVPFEGGFAFAVRYDEKIVPASVTNAEANKIIAERESNEGRRIGRKERREIREQAFSSLCRKALVRPAVITCFYRQGDNLLIVPTTGRKLSDIVTGALLKVVGAIKASTIYVAEAKGGLTTRLTSYLDGDMSAFDQFSVGGTCKLKNHDSKTVAVKLETLGEATQGLSEFIANGAQVAEISLSFGGVDFRLASDFTIKGVAFTEEIEDADSYESEREFRLYESAVRTLQFSEVVNELCALLDYKEPVSDDVAELV